MTSTDEGVALRDAGVRSRILILVGAFRGEEEDALRYDLDAHRLIASKTSRRSLTPRRASDVASLFLCI